MELICFSQYASAIVKHSFPGIKKRFDKAALYHQSHHKIQPLFEQFWNLCVNIGFPNPENPDKIPSVHCLPHVDSRNAISVCIVFVYLLDGCMYYSLCLHLLSILI
jgi:hypothetical protein